MVMRNTLFFFIGLDKKETEVERETERERENKYIVLFYRAR